MEIKFNLKVVLHALILVFLLKDNSPTIFTHLLTSPLQTVEVT